MDYELLDSGDGEKLERFGDFVLARPDPQVLWRKLLPATEWKNADGTFTRDSDNGSWSLKKNVPDRWSIDFAGLKLWIRPTPFKHVGLFPEQAANWEWMKKKIQGAVTGGATGDVEVLNLFGYTGAASLACAAAGAKVVHIDGSKTAMTWARDNAELSGLSAKPIRWILEDARDFVKRELKRGRKYKGIIMDPPAFGHGPENQVWKIEEDLMPLVELCFQLLDDKPLFFLVNGYAAGYSALAYENILRPLIEKFGGTIEKGELSIVENPKTSTENNKKGSGRSLPCGIFARWS